MASGPITSWQIDGETVETVTDFIFLGSKIIADGDCSHERRLLLERKTMMNDFANKSPHSQSYGFSRSHVRMCELDQREGWASKNWCWALELWCWRGLLRVPWTSGRSNQSILKKISLEYSLEGLMLKLKLQYSGHPLQRADSLEKTLMLGKIKGRRRRGWQGVTCLDSLIDLMDMSLRKL